MTKFWYTKKENHLCVTVDFRGVFPENSKPNLANLLKYARLITESEGFYVEELDLGVNQMRRRIHPSCEEDMDDERRAAGFAVEEHNKKEGKDLKLVRIVRVNWQGMGGGYIYLLTLEASDGCLYEAKVFHSLNDEFNLMIFRTAMYVPGQSVSLPDEAFTLLME